MSEWVSVKSWLPEHDQQVLAFWKSFYGSDRDDCIVKARFWRADKRRKGHFDTAEFEDNPEVLLLGHHITHWMPLPKPPKVKV